MICFDQATTVRDPPPPARCKYSADQSISETAGRGRVPFVHAFPRFGGERFVTGIPPTRNHVKAPGRSAKKRTGPYSSNPQPGVAHFEKCRFGIGGRWKEASNFRPRSVESFIQKHPRGKPRRGTETARISGPCPRRWCAEREGGFTSVRSGEEHNSDSIRD